MNNEYGKYLPIGSVVILKEAKKRIMIIGYAVSISDKPGKVFDYVGCLYPEGVIDSTKHLMFDHDDIYRIFAIGYSDDEQKKLSQELNEILSSQNNTENK